ncbi:MAG: hypothetical protein AUK48_14120 [Oscillatoriales cyanobacterium CG2_30_44_21]|nr:MAG: hypothetical protein AUK48_14120 [Oscillatoriales cyanobacterium CG2_30_44_21]
MNFEWDDHKSETCFRDRGFDFAYAANVFFDSKRIIHEDKRYSYGEDRYQVTGIVEGRLFFVVYTLRGEITRIISARKANQREVKQYEDSISNN